MNTIDTLTIAENQIRSMQRWAEGEGKKITGTQAVDTAARNMWMSLAEGYGGSADLLGTMKMMIQKASEQ